MKLSVSCLKSIYDRKETLELLEKIDEVDYIHLDLMDGEYTPESNFTLFEILNIYKDSKKKIDVHLMVNNPEKYIDKLNLIKPEIISFHPDSKCNINTTIKLIKSHGIKVGLAINSFIEIEKYREYLKDIDVLLIMSVKAGFGGQKFLPETYKKLDLITSLKEEYNDLIIEIDGGINKEIYEKLKDVYDIDVYVVGSYICMNENFKRPIREFKN
jgi:ribulose-phosphate 3-epimerase